VRVGSACPAGDWAEDLPPDAPTVFVRAGAPGAGDGSAAAPFATIAEALAAPGSGTIVALGKGTYDESVVVPAGVTLWGACVAETILTSSTAESGTATIVAGGRDVVVRNLRVTGERIGVRAVGRGRTARLQDIVIDGVEDLGLYASNEAAVTGSGVVVRGTRSRASDGEAGGALWVSHGASLALTRAVLERNHDVAALVRDPDSTLALADVAIRDTEGRVVDGEFGQALEIDAGGTSDVRRLVCERNRREALFVVGADARLLAADVVVRDTRATERDGGGGNGLVLQDGASAELSRALFERNREFGLSVKDEGTSLVATDLLVRDTAPVETPAPIYGLGITAVDGARVQLVRAAFERNRTYGVFARGAGTALDLADLTIRDTLLQESDGAGGVALDLEDGAAAEVERADIARSRGLAVFGIGAGTTLRLVDASVRDSGGGPAGGPTGRGLGVERAAVVEVERARFAGNEDLAAYASGASSTLRLTDVEILDTRSRSPDGLFGWGLGWALGAQGQATRLRLSGNHEVGVAAFDPGTVVRLADVEVRDTAERACADDACAGRGAGIGVGSYGGGVLQLTRFVVAQNALCGVQLAVGSDPVTGAPLDDGATIDLHDGEVRGNPIGANVQVDGYDVSRLSDTVRFYDNERNLDSTALPVPESIAAP
jgi:hypothetical protein